MIDLNKVKTVLFDFDETLCVHEGHTTDVDNAAHIANFLECGMRHYDKRKKNAQMAEFIDLCAERGIEVGVISVCASSIEMEAKCRWATEVYKHPFKNYCVGTAEHKIDMLEALSRVHAVWKSEIAIVDDLIFTVSRAADAGFTAWTPMEVVNYVNCYLPPERRD